MSSGDVEIATDEVSLSVSPLCSDFAAMPNLEIKEEIDCGMDMMEIVDNNSSSMLDSDPMDLLELVVRPGSENEVRERVKVRTPQWIEKFSQWLIHEEDEGYNGYCLYCDALVSIKDERYAFQHESSFRHVAKSENYLSFKANEKDCLNVDENVQADKNIRISLSERKYKRRSETEAINNWNWDRWLREHSWLERTEEGGTMGSCKYCKVKLNVESSKNRIRHETSSRHCANEEAIKPRLAGYQRTDTTDDKHSRRENSDNDTSLTNDPSRSPWYKELANELCLCTLCELRMTKFHFHKHLKTKGHTEKLASSGKPVQKLRNSNERLWKRLKGAHPWLRADPLEPIYGFCIYCDKRLTSVNIRSKRLQHELSAHHKEAERSCIERGDLVGESNAKSVSSKRSDKEKRNSNDGDDADYTSDGSNCDKERGKSRALRCSEKWFKLNPWYKEYSKDPEYIYCNYCNILLSKFVQCSKHEKTARHILGKRMAKRKIRDKHENIEISVPRKRSKIFPWCTVINSNYIYCKYCHLRMNVRVGRYAHQKTKQHKEAVAKLFKDKNLSPKLRVATSAKAPIKSSAIVKSRNSVTTDTNWRSRFAWLTDNPINDRPNYFTCNVCVQPVFAATPKLASKHQRSLSHIRARIKLKNQQKSLNSSEVMSVAADQTADTLAINKNESLTNSWTDMNEEEIGECKKSPSQSEMDVGQLLADYPWIVLDAGDEFNYAYCKYCDIRVNIYNQYKDRHQASAKHRSNEHLYKQRNMKNYRQSSDDETRSSSNCHSSNSKVKAKNSSKKRNYKGTDKDSDERMSKRQKLKDESEIDVAKQLTAAHMEIIRLTRKYSRDNAVQPKKRNPLFKSPFAVAARLENVNRPESHEATNSPVATAQQATTSPSNFMQPIMQTPSTPAPVGRNAFDLFFNSVSETVKSLPLDLAVEAKAKVMQIVYDLEMQAIRRKDGRSAANGPYANAMTIASTRTTKQEPRQGDGGNVGCAQKNKILDAVETVRTVMNPDRQASESSNAGKPALVNGFKLNETRVAIVNDEKVDDVIVLDLPSPSKWNGEAVQTEDSSSSDIKKFRCVPIRALRLSLDMQRTKNS